MLIKWNDEAQKALSFKTKCQKRPLIFPQFDKPLIFTTDASDYCMDGVLQREDESRKIRPHIFVIF